MQSVCPWTTRQRNPRTDIPTRAPVQQWSEGGQSRSRWKLGASPRVQMGPGSYRSPELCHLPAQRGHMDWGSWVEKAGEVPPPCAFPGGAAALTRPRVPARWPHQPPSARTWVALSPFAWSAVHTVSSGPRTSSMGRCWARAASARPLRYVG